MVRFRMFPRMASAATEIFHHQIRGDARPAFRRAPLPLIEDRQTAAILDDPRQPAQNLIAVHPMEGLPQGGGAKLSKVRQSILRPGLNPPDIAPAPRRGEPAALGEHVRVGIHGDNLGDDA
jgi:hypothetical protein